MLPGFHPQYHLAGAQAHAGLLGTLLPAGGSSGFVTPGVTYQLSARVKKDDQVGSPPASIAMSFGSNGADGYPEHATDIHSSVTDAANWTLITGAITATTASNTVLLRYWKDGDWAAIDDVVVCRAALSSSGWGWLTGVLGVVLVGLGLAGLALIGGLFGNGRHRSMGDGIRATSTGGAGLAAGGVTPGDINGDGTPDSKVADNDSPRPTDRVFYQYQSKKLLILIIALALIASGGFLIFDRWGNTILMNNESTPTTTTTAPSSTTNPVAATPSPTPTPPPR